MQKETQVQVLINQLSTTIAGQDDDSPLEILYSHYSEFCYPASPEGNRLYHQLQEIFHQIAPDYVDQLMDLANMIGCYHERVSFIAGLKNGVRLASELHE